MRMLLLIVYCVLTIPTYPQKQNYSAKVMLGMETYAFLKGQGAALKKVASQFPALKDDAIAIEKSSTVIFGRAEINIKRFLKDELGDAEFNRIEHRIDSLLSEQLKQPIQKKEYAQNFIEKVKSELQLSKTGGIQKGIISFAYHDAPHQEVTDGHIIHFTTKGHPKAEESAVALSIPRSWSAEEAEMPATVQQFTSHDGKGIEKILIMVHDLDEENQDIVLNEKSVAEMIPPQSHVIRTEAVVIDNLPAMMIEVEEVLNISHNKKKIRMLQFMFTHEQKLYCLQGSVGPADVNQNLDRHIKKYEPLFRLIAASTQIID
ncbi:hypothetical protein D0809_13765 [Flavobacterium circumlabens]|uniref:Uncharacterized protein n=1 Tax=Flavobacterium circumlabens TaxID=2133765 RepID=A0A4Y7UCK9_9FLAO|nr:hypothetical protein [Flavobacterium circumlabens]TCN57647.1 hypothetical protein EV142_104309 [Flavobacterium circumlabens]TEB43951.1 hypothetical protein D0809_13765 [Flavobacterium circumlabens]